MTSTASTMPSAPMISRAAFLREDKDEPEQEKEQSHLLAQRAREQTKARAKSEQPFARSRRPQHAQAKEERE